MLIKDFITLSKKFEETKIDPEVDRELRSEKDRFEKDFVAVNCEVQNLRSENEALQDEINAKAEAKSRYENEIKEKDSLIKFFSDKLADFSGK